MRALGCWTAGVLLLAASEAWGAAPPSVLQKSFEEWAEANAEQVASGAPYLTASAVRQDGKILVRVGYAGADTEGVWVQGVRSADKTLLPLGEAAPVWMEPAGLGAGEYREGLAEVAAQPLTNAVEVRLESLAVSGKSGLLRLVVPVQDKEGTVPGGAVAIRIGDPIGFKCNPGCRPVYCTCSMCTMFRCCGDSISCNCTGSCTLYCSSC